MDINKKKKNLMEEWNFKFQKLKGAYGGGSAPGYDNRGKKEKKREREKRKQQNQWND